MFPSLARALAVMLVTQGQYLFVVVLIRLSCCGSFAVIDVHSNSFLLLKPFLWIGFVCTIGTIDGIAKTYSSWDPD